jgi:hypothetical protein
MRPMSAPRIDHDGHTLAWLGMSTFALSMLFVWQGLDFTDMGFWLTGYQQFYTHPDTIWSVCWLSSFIGHWIGLALGGDVLAYRLGHVGLVTASALLAYLLLASQLGRSRILAGMVLLTVFFTRGYVGNWADYNQLTALFYLVGAGFLFFGLTGNRMLAVVLAGAVLGANGFIRLPNFIGVGLVAAIWLQAWACRWSWGEVFKWSACFLGGFSLGMASVWGLIVLQGHELIYLRGIRAMFGEAGGANSSHSGSGLFKLLIDDLVRAFAEALLLLLVVGSIANWVRNQRTLPAAGAVLATAMLVFYVVRMRGQWGWIVPGTCFVILLSIVVLEARRNTRLALLAFIAGIVLFLTPLGSTNGIRNSVFGMWLALPLTLVWMWQRSGSIWSVKASGDGHIGKLPNQAGGFHFFAIMMALALLFQSLAWAWQHTFLDSKNRYAMTHPIAHPLLGGTYTTAARAKVVTELLGAMTHFAKPGDDLLAYNGIPALYFLTNTHPWLGNPWPDFDGAERISAQIRDKERSGASLPTIVRATGNTYVNSWPVAARSLPTAGRQDEARRVFGQFEQRHGYAVVWSNDFFEILTSVPRPAGSGVQAGR